MARGRKFRRPSNKSSKHFQIKDTEPSPDYDLRPPIFSLKYMPYQGHCCISKCQKGKKALILDKILKLSQSKWKEIRGFPKKSGFETIPHHRFKVSLPATLTPEVTIEVARYDGDGGRFAGFREKDIFHIVLVGKDLYPH
jgi:hypothetical protein